jgi:polar amino acid transport system substrate-binding protein
MKYISLLFVTFLTGWILAGCSALPDTIGRAIGGEISPAGSVPGSDPSVITVGVAADFAPYVSLNARKNLVGFDIDLMNAIAEETGMDFSFFNVDADQLLAGVSQCKLDLGISALTRTEEYNLYLLFSDPYYTVPSAILVKEGNLDITGRDSLAGMAIGVMAGFPGEEQVSKLPGAKLSTYATTSLAIQDLVIGYLEAVITDLPHARWYAATKSNNLKLAGEGFTPVDYGIAICKQRPELAAKINAGIATLKANGKLDKLVRKWGLDDDL